MSGDRGHFGELLAFSCSVGGRVEKYKSSRGKSNRVFLLEIRTSDLELDSSPVAKHFAILQRSTGESGGYRCKSPCFWARFCSLPSLTEGSGIRGPGSGKSLDRRQQKVIRFQPEQSDSIVKDPAAERTSTVGHYTKFSADFRCQNWPPPDLRVGSMAC